MSRQIESRHRPAFTLMELLLVVSLTARVVSLLMPSLVSARQEARRVFCLNNLHQLGILAQTYSQDDPDAEAVAVPQNGNFVALIDGLYDYGGSSGSLDNLL